MPWWSKSKTEDQPAQPSTPQRPESFLYRPDTIYTGSFEGDPLDLIHKDMLQWLPPNTMLYSNLDGKPIRVSEFGSNPDHRGGFIPYGFGGVRRSNGRQFYGPYRTE